MINYRQSMPVRLSAFADDSGSKATGRYQGGLTVSYDNWWTLSDLFYVSVNRALGGGLEGDRGSRGHTAHYSVPLGYWLLGTTASRSKYHQSVAGATQTYVYRGASTNLEVKLARLIYRDAVRKTSVAIRGFKRTSSNYIDDTEIEVQRRALAGFEASINHREFIGGATLDANLAYRRGTGAFHALRAPEEPFGEGTSRLRLTTLDAALSAPFQWLGQRFRYGGLARAQFNHTPLTPQDRFAIGGRHTVRGFDGELSLAGDRGWLLRNELSVALANSGQEGFIGIDCGRVDGPSSEFLLGRRLAGAVFGLRGSVHHLQYEIFVGRPISKPTGFQTARTTAGFSLNYSF